MVWIIAFVLWCICGAIGAAICRPKNRMEEGAALGFFLGPIGVVITLFLPTKSASPFSNKVSSPQSAWPTNIRCKNCDNRIHANTAQLKEGLRCPRCGAQVRAG